jgi:hypothetical protein
MQEIQEYSLADISIICPDCGLAFATNLLVAMPAITPHDVIEADLHRVLPISIRSAMIAVCPECNYAAWKTTFGKCKIKPEFLLKEKEIDPAKKYALAIKSGRNKNLHALDLAFLALNGTWCAREAGQTDELWLELAAHEHQRAFNENAELIDGYTHLVMAEIWRQLKVFDKAIYEYKLALADNSMLPELVNHQMYLASKNVSSATALPTYLVSQLFPEDTLNFDPQLLQIEEEPIVIREENIQVAQVAQTQMYFSEAMNPDAYYIEPEIAQNSNKSKTIKVETKNDKFPELIIDGLDSHSHIHKAKPKIIVPDYTQAINQVENFLNYSYQPGWTGFSKAN